jgi:two-component system, chemotaxis family, chemotaxis protein CheY
MPLNVLVVDDSAVMRAMIARVVRLTGVPLGEPHEAGNGAEGLRLLREHWIDLVLLDVNMPVMDGEQMLRRLRADAETASLPVIVVSTESSETRVAALEELDVAFVHKPFAPEDLRATILRITGLADDDHHAAPAAPGGDVDF